MVTMKELNQTSNCYICGKKCAYARPWAMTSESSDGFNVNCGISVACPTHDREAAAQSLVESELQEGFVLTYFAITERVGIQEAFEMATSLLERQAALYAEDE